MRAWPVSIRTNQVVILLVVGGFAAAYAQGLVWATNALEGKWLVALVAGLGLVWLAIASGRFERLLLGFLILSIPFNVDVRFGPLAASTISGSQPLRIEAIDLILLCLYPVWIARLLAERRSLISVWPPGATALLCLLGWSALSIVNSVDRTLTAFSLVSLAKGFLCYVYLANHVKTRRDLQLVAGCLVAGLFVESLIACLQYAMGSTLGLQVLGESRQLVTIQLGSGQFSRVVGTLGHPNPLGRYLASILPLVFLFTVPILRMRWRARLVLGTAALLGTTALALTLSRGAWLSLALACIVLVAYLRKQRRMRVGFAPVLLAVLALGLALAFFTPLIMARWTEYDAGTAIERLPQMRVAWSMIVRHPVFGVGLNNYTTVMHLYDETPEGLAFHYAHSVHNGYLLLAAEVGLVGLGLLGWFLLAVARRGWRRIAAAPDGLSWVVLLGLAVGCLALLTHATVEPKYLARDTLFLIYSAILAATRPSNREDER